jgi:hypothetical protein
MLQTSKPTVVAGSEHYRRYFWGVSADAIAAIEGRLALSRSNAPRLRGASHLPDGRYTMSIFDDFAGRDGGTYRPNPANSQLEAQLAAFIEQQTKFAITNQSRRFQKKRPPIEFGVIANVNFNAVAAIEQGADVIGVYFGAIAVLQVLFQNMLSHPLILKNIGDASSEEYRSRGLDFAKITGDNFAGRGNLRPNDSVRSHYAGLLAWMAIQFIMEHEFAHVINGHVEWLNATTGLGALRETGASAIPNLSNMDLQTLEFDADCYGAASLTRVTLQAVPKGLWVNTFLQTPAQILFGILFSLYCVFRLFHNSPPQRDDDFLACGDHPPAYLRLYVVLATIASFEHFTGLFSEADLDHSLMSVFQEAEAAFSHVSTAPQVHFRSLFPENWSTQCRQACDILKGNWTKNIRGQLMPYYRGRVLEP